MLSRPPLRSVSAAVPAIAVVAVLFGLACPAPVRGQPATEPPPIAVPPVTDLPDITVSAPEPRYVAPTTRDRIGRIWAPVLINGKGPFRLVLDTGATRSAVTQRVVDQLGVPVQANSVRLRGVTGTALTSSIRVDSVEVGDLLVQTTVMPIVVDAFGGAEGVLGAEGLADKRIVIDFRRDRIEIRRSRMDPPPAGFTRVPFKFNAGQGMRVSARIGAVPVVALIDTGAQMTVGNSALREALFRRRSSPDELDEEIIGVTTDIQRAGSVRVPSIYAGNLIVRNAAILFSDLVIFDHWKLSDRPTILIGMDVLGVVKTLIIDYKLRELQLETG